MGRQCEGYAPVTGNLVCVGDTHDDLCLKSAIRGEKRSPPGAMQAPFGQGPDGRDHGHAQRGEDRLGLRRALGRADEIGEQHGGQDAVRRWRGRGVGDELLDDVGEQADDPELTNTPYFFPNAFEIFSSNSIERGPNPANQPSLRHCSTAFISSSP